MSVAAEAPSVAPPRRRPVARFVVTDDAVDIAFLLVAATLGLVGFKTTYGGYGFLAGGLLGLLFGVAIAYLSVRLELPSLVAIAGGVVAFFALGGGTVLRSTAIAGVIPTPTTVRALAAASIHGWRDLLTLLPPVGSSGPLLVIPYLLGIAAGVVGYLLARRTSYTLLPAVAPVGVLTASILFGTPQPASLTLQGSVFAVVVLAWASIRNGRRRVVTAGGSRRAWRPAAGLAMLAVCGAAATVLGPRLPLAHSHKRVVLRNYVQPPFDASAYPSPLGAFRTYVDKKDLKNKTLMTIHGLPEGARVQFATMDTYDGLAWGVSNGAPGTAGAFQRVGSQIPTTMPGKRVTLQVTIGAYPNVWLPDAGATDSIKFSGSNASALAAAYRYNLATGTAVIPSGLQPGDSYTLVATIPPAKWSKKVLNSAEPASKPKTFQDVPPAVATKAKLWANASSPTPYAKLSALAAHLRSGAYSDGSTSSSLSLPGHGDKRLEDFLTGTQLVGDDEQYAAAFGLLANSLGYATRVVIGATPEPNGIVQGKDVHAWVEVDLTKVGWLPFNVTPPTSHRPNPQPPQVLPKSRSPQVPPAAPASPPTAQSAADTSKAHAQHAHKHTQHALPGVLRVLISVVKVGGPPIGAIIALIALIVGTKAVRRHRRRTRGSPAQRVSAGWRELVDLAVDLGADRPRRDTRRGALRRLGMPDLAPLAAAADAANFGPEYPNEAVARQYWRQVDELRVRVLRGAGRLRRWTALLSLASLNGPRLRTRTGASAATAESISAGST